LTLISILHYSFPTALDTPFHTVAHVIVLVVGVQGPSGELVAIAETAAPGSARVDKLLAVFVARD
jgi:hypothetical protein